MVHDNHSILWPLRHEKNIIGSQKKNYHPMNDEIYYLEIFLPNGDYCTGYWFDNLPNGQGKY